MGAQLFGRVCGVVLLVGASASGVCQQTKLSLDEAVADALAGNRSVKAAVLDEQRAAETAKAAATQRLPHFSVLLDAGETLTRPYLDLSAGYLGSLGSSLIPSAPLRLYASRMPSLFTYDSVTEPLSGQYGIGLQIAGLSIRRQAAEQRTREARQAVAQKVRTLFGKLQEAGAARDAAAADIALYVELERVAALRGTERTALRSELLQIRTRHLQADADLLSAEQDVADAKEQMNLLLGRDVESELEIEPSMNTDAPLPTPQEAFAQACAMRPDLQQAQLQVDAADLDRRAKKAEYIPDVSLEAEYINFVDSSLPVGGGGYAEVGVQLRWEPFTWGRKRHELAEKTAAANQARLTAADAASKARSEIDAALRAARTAQQMAAVSVAQVEAAAQILRETEARYGERAVLWDEVLRAQAAKAQASQAHAHAQSSLQTSLANLSKAIGEDR